MAWQQAVQALQYLEKTDLPANSETTLRLEEFLAVLVPESHPHNYSEALTRECISASPRPVREAEQLMIAASLDISVSKIAKELQVSLRPDRQTWRRDRAT
jgi:hypothetical protein